MCYVEDATDTPEWLTETKKRYQHNTVPIITKVTIADGDVEVSLIGGFTEFKESLDFEKEVKEYFQIVWAKVEPIPCELLERSQYAGMS